MHFMNRCDIDDAVRFSINLPVLHKAALILQDLMNAVDGCSDGWCYWKAPVKAADKLMTLIERDRDNWGKVRTDITEAELQKALTPIRSFCTKHPTVGWRP